MFSGGRQPSTLANVDYSGTIQNLHHLNSWIDSLSPDPFMQSEFYRVLRSMIGTFRCGTGLTSAPYLLSAFWEAAEMEVEIWKIPPCTGLTEGMHEVASASSSSVVYAANGAFLSWLVVACSNNVA